jgi:hypothetical protein
LSFLLSFLDAARRRLFVLGPVRLLLPCGHHFVVEIRVRLSKLVNSRKFSPVRK